MTTTAKPTINTYVSDMLALEQHVLQPIDHQSKDEGVAKSPTAARVIAEILSNTTAHVDGLRRHLESIGGHAGAPLKSGVASVLGVAAAAIGNARKTEVSKYLRDDNAALALVSAGYTMLHTTALAFGDSATAALAQKNLADTATSVMRISGVLPIVVLAELSEEGLLIDQSLSSEAERNVENAWKDGGAHSSS